MKISLNLLLVALILSISSKAQNTINHIKIYAVKDTTSIWGKEYPGEVNWRFLKVDTKKNTIQFKSYLDIEEGDPAPDLTNLPTLFIKERTEYFKVINTHKIKVPRIKSTHLKRAWNDFATSGRSGGQSAEIYFINGDTLRARRGIYKYILDKGLTTLFNLTQ
ncbi:hypothetical protein HNP99_000904 [Flavobacterium sp. 28A]|uniref:hypothetical protein n=1 Tax=Flavobacterium sp. 28A TaxID=2735895 RepID=UPI00156D4068|nr:hypothetical protein [Flavobacterium sp. 28A]NRT14564.1 hypothetical protein [Flavobacterium sp. 28A]